MRSRRSRRHCNNKGLTQAVSLTGGLPFLIGMENATKTGAYDSIRLGNQLCFPLYACSKEVIRKYRKPLDRLGLTYTQYLVMMALWENGSMTEGELGGIVYLDSGTLTPLLKRLEKQGLINRTRPDDNERKLLLSLTEKGEALKNEALTVPEEMQGCIRLSEEELGQLKELLNKALARMEAE